MKQRINNRLVETDVTIFFPYGTKIISEFCQSTRYFIDLLSAIMSTYSGSLTSHRLVEENKREVFYTKF